MVRKHTKILGDMLVSNLINIDEVREFIKSQEWTFAKTYAKSAPHEYIIKSTDNENGFERFAQFIRDYGFIAYYFKRTGKYFIYGDYYYWTMGNPIPETTVLNRAQLADYNLYNRMWIKKNKPDD